MVFSQTIPADLHALSVSMADAYYRSLYFNLDSPEDLELLGMLLALPRRRRSDAIKRALKQHLPTILDGPPLGPDAVRTSVASARARRRQRAPGRPGTPSRRSTTLEEFPARDAPEPGAATPRAEDAPDLQAPERLFDTKLDQLMKSSWIG